ncbi:MAG: hypothetical protein H7196_04520 [candidate division SR1 bacterium]|nr:hypothetical protein [candidate division SR1 bacterium]
MFKKILVFVSVAILTVAPISAKSIEVSKKLWPGDLSVLCQPLSDKNEYSALSDLSKKIRLKVNAKADEEPDNTCLILQVYNDGDIAYITFEGNGDSRYSTKEEINFHKFYNPPITRRAPKKVKKTIVTGVVK